MTRQHRASSTVVMSSSTSCPGDTSLRQKDRPDRFKWKTSPTRNHKYQVQKEIPKETYQNLNLCKKTTRAFTLPIIVPHEDPQGKHDNYTTTVFVFTPLLSWRSHSQLQAVPRRRNGKPLCRRRWTPFTRTMYGTLWSYPKIESQWDAKEEDQIRRID